MRPNERDLRWIHVVNYDFNDTSGCAWQEHVHRLTLVERHNLAAVFHDHILLCIVRSNRKWESDEPQRQDGRIYTTLH
jgi:hypothetical protein